MKRFTKNLALFLAVSMVLCFSLTACANQNGETKTDGTSTPSTTTTTDSTETAATPVRVAAMTGPTGMGLAELMANSADGKAEGKYEFKVVGTPDEIVAELSKGTLDMAAVPCNLASVLYNKTKGGVQVAAINTLGVLYVVDTSGEIKSVADLKGRTILSTGKGSTPEYALNYVLSANGIDPAKDIAIEYKSEATEVAAALQDGSAQTALLPQPYVTTVQMKNEKVKVALDLTAEWDKLGTDSSLVTGVVVVRKEFAEKNKDAVNTFLKEYKASVEKVNADPADASKKIEQFGIAPAAVAEKAIPHCNITFIDGTDMKTNISGYLKTLFDQNPKSVGGALPDDDFYYAG